MKIALGYHLNPVEMEFPEERFRIVGLPEATSPGGDGSLLARSLASPWGGPPLATFLEGKRRLAVVISDATRPTGSAGFLRLLERYLTRSGAKVRIVVATGIHRAVTGAEMEALAPSDILPEAARACHSPDDAAELADFGQTSSGNHLRLNSVLMWADGILVLGAVGFHYFAGFSGGRKSVLPGLACRHSIIHNHCLVFEPGTGRRHPAVATASLEGNPVHRDMLEALEQVGLDRLFMVNVSLAPDGGLVECVSGHPVEAHLEACRRYLDRHAVAVDGPADVVVTSAGGYPRDINAIQAHKTIELGRLPLRPGGTLVVLAACAEGLGSPQFLPWFRFKEEAEFRAALLRDYQVNGQTALSLYEKARRYRILLVSQLPPEQVVAMGLVPFSDPQAALAEAMAGQSGDWRGLVIPAGAVTLCRPGVTG